jgi:hypothetical protein
MSNNSHAQANTVGFALLELARNPELQNLLRTEIHSAVGAGGLSNVAYDRMPLLNAFIKVRVLHVISEQIVNWQIRKHCDFTQQRR